jgi:phenylalanyl-tRNA synthetase beta chain
LAIAGIKGGQRAGVNQRTKRIVVEAANFDQVSIYRTMKRLSLVTDAALRFSHGLNPRLAQWGMDRATVLLRQILGVKLLDSLALGNEPSEKKVIEFNVAKFNKLIGSQFSEKLIVSYLTRLGFAVRDLPQENLLLVEPPRWRDDIDIFEDVAEEVIRLYGLDELQSRPPVVSLQPPEIQAEVTLKDKVREILMNFGFSEVYNYSLTGEKGENGLELENPVSLDRRYLRTNLLSGLKANLRNNTKDFETIRIFEIGKIWNKEGERLHLGLALKETSAWLTLKGILNRLLTGIGLTDVLMRPAESKRLLIESYHHVLGFLEAVSQSEALAEIDLSRLTQLALEENEYQPLPKYPAIVRDISLVVSASLMVGEIITFINNLSLKNVVDIDLIDYLENFGGDRRKKSLTFRIVFRSSVRTLTDEEVNQELAKLQTALVKNFQAVIR